MNFKQKWNLVKELTTSGFKLRNEGTFLGVFWYLLNPLLMLAVLYFVFSSGTGIKHYAFYLLIGLVQWNFLRLATVDGMRSILDREELLRTLNFPKEAIIISSILKALISHAFEILILFIFILAAGLASETIFFFPIILLLQVLLVLGINLIFSPLIVYVRDLENIWNFILTIGWFVTPIFYSISAIPRAIQPIYSLNPMAQLITLSRDVLIYNSLPSFYSMIYVLLFSLVLICIGIMTFRKISGKIAEII